MAFFGYTFRDVRRIGKSGAIYEVSSSILGKFPRDGQNLLTLCCQIKAFWRGLIRLVRERGFAGAFANRWASGLIPKRATSGGLSALEGEAENLIKGKLGGLFGGNA